MQQLIQLRAGQRKQLDIAAANFANDIIAELHLQRNIVSGNVQACSMEGASSITIHNMVLQYN